MRTFCAARRMARQLQSDAALLCSLGVMDYSLLLGIRTVEYVPNLLEWAAK